MITVNIEVEDDTVDDRVDFEVDSKSVEEAWQHVLFLKEEVEADEDHHGYLVVIGASGTESYTERA